LCPWSFGRPAKKLACARSVTTRGEDLRASEACVVDNDFSVKACHIHQLVEYVANSTWYSRRYVDDGSRQQCWSKAKAGDVRAAHITYVEKVSPTVKCAHVKAWRLVARFNPSDLPGKGRHHECL
jgi:hypothetical protein